MLRAPQVVSRLLLLYIYRPPPREALAVLTQATAGAQAHSHQQRTTLGAVASAACESIAAASPPCALQLLRCDAHAHGCLHARA